MSQIKIPSPTFIYEICRSGRVDETHRSDRVREIRRLRARVNKLIKTINDGDTNGNHNYNDQDLIPEEET